MFYEALKKKYEAEIEESLVTLRIYMNKSVGIGEHSDLITELDKYVTKLAFRTMLCLVTFPILFPKVLATNAASGIISKAKNAYFQF